MSIITLTSNAQNSNTIINKVDFSIPLNKLKDGKLMLDINADTEAIGNSFAIVERWSDKVDVPLTAEFLLVLQTAGGEIALTPTTAISNNDFVPSWAIVSKDIYFILTFNSSTGKTGTIKLKYREKLGGEWQSYKYSASSYETVLVGVANDEYTTAITLNAGPTKIAGTTRDATQSSQSAPSCTNYGLTADVWYKFTASSTTHTINLTNVKMYGVEYGTRSAKTVVYNSSLNLMHCSSNEMTTVSNLIVGNTYYVRLWVDDNNSARTMDFDISLASNGPNVITGLSRNGYTFTVNYQHDSSVPPSDVTFDWSVVPGEVEPATDYSVLDGEGPHQIIIVGGPYAGDTTVRLKVRMKRVSTGELLTDWYAYSSLIWFDNW